jgi:hypothetical protein
MVVSGKPGEVPNWRTVFGFPIVIGLLSLAGLISALLFDELSRYFSWIAVGSPVILLSWLIVQRRHR